MPCKTSLYRAWPISRRVFCTLSVVKTKRKSVFGGLDFHAARVETKKQLNGPKCPSCWFGLLVFRLNKNMFG